MRDLAFRADQWARRYEPHVEPLNRLVDELGALDDAGHPPYIPPMYRGVEAPALVILRDPGPKAGGAKGSGFLCVENDDQTAERFWHFLDEARIDHGDMVPWNAYPWYINAKPKAVQLAAGVEPLRRIIELMPRLRVVLLLGVDAKVAWRLLVAANGDLVRARRIDVLETHHPSRQALQHPDAVERGRREEHIRSTLSKAARLLGTTPTIDEVLVDVQARPASYATAAEGPWKAAVAEAVGVHEVPAGARFALEVDFRLPAPATSNDAWDLDNLIKPTLDALGGVIGRRRWRGTPQTDDERVDRIVATKRTVRDGERPGARIRVTVLPEEPGTSIMGTRI